MLINQRQHAVKRHATLLFIPGSIRHQRRQTVAEANACLVSRRREPSDQPAHQVMICFWFRASLLGVGVWRCMKDKVNS
jgi:uncharacterized RmlC-like cupin family protein